MSILDAAKAATVLEAAIGYAEANVSVLPVGGKKPAIHWGAYQTRRPSHAMIHAWANHGKLKGVGVICGRVSGNLVVVDLDGEDAIAAYRANFPNLTNTFTVRSGSGKGQHLYYYTDLPQDTARATAIPSVGNVELRADGCYVVAPPSIHPTTDEPYVVETAVPVKRVPNLNTVEAWIIDLIRQKRARVDRPVPMDQPRRLRANPTAYAKKGVDNQISALRTATPGNRNNMLNFAAFCIGRLLGNPASGLTRAQVETELTQAAAAIGLMNCDADEIQTRRTIRSGLDAGMKRPQHIPGKR